MKIIRLETFSQRDVGFVRITAEDGSDGWGQLSTYNSDISAAVLHRQLAPHVLGHGFDELESLLELIPEREHKFPGSYIARVMGGFDTAVWDWRGKQADKPVTSLLGGSPGPLRAYASSMIRTISPDDEARRFAELRERDGFDAFKFRVGSECGHDRDESPGRTEAMASTLRKTLGDDVALLADANSCYSVAKAIEVGRLLEASGVEHFEEPCPYWLLDDTRAVTAELSLDVTGGEQDADLQQWQRIVDSRVVDVVQPDILYVGGMVRALKVAAMAEVASLPVTPHCANLSLVTLFTMHLLRAMPNAGKYLEFSIEGPDVYPWQEGLFVENPYQVNNGQLTVSDRPGWGVEVSPEWLAQSTWQVSELD